MPRDHKYTAAMDSLSFLRAAEVLRGDVPDFDLTQAFHALKRYTDKVEQAAREAEDAKVVEFRESSMAAIACVFKESNKDPKGWDGLSGAAREGWRARYRAARKFFEES